MQCDTARSPTWRTITLRRVTFFTNIFTKTNFSAKPFKTVYQGPKWVGFMEKENCKKSCDTAFLSESLLPRILHNIIIPIYFSVSSA